MNKLISKKTVIESRIEYVKRNNMEQKIGSYTLLFNERKYCMESPIVSIDFPMETVITCVLSRTINVLVK